MLFYLLEHVTIFVQPGVEDPVYLVRPPVDGNLAPFTKQRKSGRARTADSYCLSVIDYVTADLTAAALSRPSLPLSACTTSCRLCWGRGFREESMQLESLGGARVRGIQTQAPCSACALRILKHVSSLAFCNSPYIIIPISASSILSHPPASVAAVAVGLGPSSR